MKTQGSRAIYMLCFVNTLQIEAYLKAHGLLKGTDENANSQLGMSIMTNSK